MTTYTIGGSLSANTPTYVVRQADRDLELCLRAGGFCYVLNSRQMGKSSLKFRTMQKLQAEGVACAEIDLTGIGAEGVSAAQWYGSIAYELATQFDLEAEFEAFWDRHQQLPDVKRLGTFIETIVLDCRSSRVVIFIDEIDKVLSLGSFTDDFFGMIRSFAERQAVSSKHGRLSFVLLGVATPTDLIENKQITPFNIGRAIELNGFQLTDDLSPLTNNFAEIFTDPESVIAEILYWTGGQPFLTQKVCQLVTESPQIEIEDLVYKYIINNWEYQDDPVHLRTIANRLLFSPTQSSYLLEQYRYIITAKSSPDVENRQQQQWLRLSGLVVERNGRLQAYNPIYVRVFNLDWVDRELTKISPHVGAFLDWIDAGKPKKLLLRGEALAEVLAWRDRQTQVLSYDRNMFLIQGQQFEYDRQVKKIQSRTKKLIKVLIFLLISGFFMLWVMLNTYSVNQFDRTSNQILGQSEFAPVDALKSAVINAKKFENIRPTLLASTTLIPKLALQKLVDNIQEIDEINTYQNGINAVNYCQNDRIFSAGDDGTVNVWDRRNSSAPTQTIINLGAEVKIKSISQSSSTNCSDTFATGSSDGLIRLWQWDGATKVKVIAKIPAHQSDDSNNEGVQNVRLTSDLNYIFSTGKTDGLLKKWKVTRDWQITQIWEKRAHQNGVVSLNFNGDKNQIGTAGKDGTAKIWDLEGNSIATLRGHSDAVNSITFCSTVSKTCNFAEIATSSSDGTVRLWKADGKYITTINAHIGEVRTVRFSPDGKLLATASAQDPTANNGSSVRIWDLADSQLVTEFKGHHGAIESMRFKPDRHQLTTNELATSGQDDSIIRVWQIPRIMPKQDKHQGKINSVRFDPQDSHYFITAGDDGTIRWWYQSDNVLPQLRINFKDYRQKVKFKTVRIHPVVGKQLIAAGDSTGAIRLLKIDGDRMIELSKFDTQQGELNSIDWNYQPYNRQPERYLLATTGSKADNIKIWEIDVKQHQLAAIEPIYSKKWGVAPLTLRFSANGENIAFGAAKGLVGLLQNINRTPSNPDKFTLLEQDLKVASKVIVSFRPDSKSLAVVSQDGEIRQLYLSDRSDKLILKNPTKTYQAGTENAGFSQDGESIATGGAGAALRLWDLQGRQKADFRGYWGTIRSISFSKDDREDGKKDGKYILAGGDDGVPRRWRIDRDIPTLIKQGCARLNQAYLPSHSIARSFGQQIDEDLQAVCPRDPG